MNKHRPIALDDQSAAFVDRQVEDGHYDSASEVIAAGLRLLEEHESHIAAVREALIEGENSGPGEPFDFDAFIARMHEEHARWKDSVCSPSAEGDNGLRQKL